MIIIIIILTFKWYVCFSEITDYQADYMNLALLEPTGSTSQSVKTLSCINSVGFIS
jgi:hypothetical protein